MGSDWERYLARWQTAALVDSPTADRIRAFEQEHAGEKSFRWPTMLALAFGALLLGAGVLLFVSAHWEELSPSWRFSLVLGLVGIFHITGAFTARSSEWPAIALHTVGTIALGAGIALTGQIFNLAEHWPGAIMLWAAGAALAWAVLRHWTQGALTALLIPAWLASEWEVAMGNQRFMDLRPSAEGLCLLAFVYLSARSSNQDDALRRALGWIGGIAVIPLAAWVSVSYELRKHVSAGSPLPTWPTIVAWTLAFVLPLGAAVLLRGQAAWMTAICGVWVAVLGELSAELLIYVWCAMGAVGLIVWGVKESRRERINLGVLGFAITVLVFYFSSVMDKLGRSASLIGLGLLFLAGGWELERIRRRLIASVSGSAP